MPLDLPEISDLIVDYDPETLARRPVRLVDVEAALAGRRAALRVARRIPTLADGTLDPEAVDDLLIRAHCELQRLNEEFLHGRRVLGALSPMLAALRAAGVSPIRVVDLGCGLGFVVRWLAAFGELGPDVQLTGCDYNAALIRTASQLARDEGLRCDFQVANALALEEPAHVVMSTGVIHHFRGDALPAFFANQAGAQAFLHYDIQPSWAAPLGAWIFHKARMRIRLAQLDGVLSARRAHSGEALLSAARAALPGWRTGLYDLGNPWIPIFKVLRPVLGCRPALAPAFVDALGARASRLVGFGEGA